MKKALRLLLIQVSIITIIISTVFQITVHASSNTYNLNELELKVTIPSEYSVITRDTSANDPIFSKIGATKTEIISQFKASNIYLNAISDTNNEEIVVTMAENNLTNFSLLSDTSLNALASTLVSQYSDYGFIVSNYEIFNHSQAKFIRISFYDEGNTVHALQYYTIYNGKAMNFTMRSYEGSLSYSQWSTIKAVVDSIIFNEDPPVSEPGEDTNSFVYTDKESGVKFTVPDNWKQKEFTEDREYIDVKFVSTKEDGCTMIYGSTDMWSQMSVSDRLGYTRSELNNSAFTKSDIAEMYSTTADKITTVTYNGVQYFKGETNYTSDAYSVDITVTMTQLVCIDNGWMYMFQFGGASTHKLYSDFENLLKSVQYPTVSNACGVGSSGNINSEANNSYDGLGVIAIVMIFIIAAIIVIAFIISRKNDNKQKTSTSCTLIYDTPTPEATIETEQTVYCRNCGQALPSDSDFCHKCGTKVIKE